jgi:hypothetical protein
MDQIKNRGHLYIIILCAIILVFSYYLSIEGDIILCLAGFKQYPLSNLCLFKNISGIDCPNCGLTRSIISISHLDFDKAWYFNRMGILIYVFIILQIPYRLYLLWKKRGSENRYFKKIFKVYGYIIIIALIVNWIFNLIQGRFLL